MQLQSLILPIPGSAPGTAARKQAAPSMRLAFVILAVTAILGLNACLSQSEKEEDVSADKGYLFALTSDRKTTGSYSVYGLDSSYSHNDIDPVHSDAVVSYLGGDDIYIINRKDRDNLQVVDRHNLKTVLQIPFPPTSNPQDVAVKDGLIYVCFLARDTVGIYRLSDGSLAGEIDITAHTDAEDSIAEAYSMTFVDGDLFVLLQNMDENAFWAPLTPHLLKIDVASKTVKKSLALPYRNPQGLTWDAAAHRLYVTCLGEYLTPDFSSTNTDGAIVSVNPATMELAGIVALEKDLGGNVNNALLYDGKLFVDIGMYDGESISAVSLSDGKAVEIVKLGAYSLGGLALDPVTKTLFVGDMKEGGPGLRLFDLTTYEEKSAPGIDIGAAPPSDFAVIR